MFYRPVCILAEGTINVGPASIPWRLMSTRQGYYASLADTVKKLKLDLHNDTQALVAAQREIALLLGTLLELRKEINPFHGPLFEHNIAVQDVENGRTALKTFFAAVPEQWGVVIEDAIAHNGVLIQYFTTPSYLPPQEARACLPSNANTVSSPFINWDWNNGHLFWIRDFEERRKQKTERVCDPKDVIVPPGE